jgi:CDP-diacylglycerol--glycerol-3-phosphate 3-phosphatidyltransferase
MSFLPGWLQEGFVRFIKPLMDALVRRRVHPNLITTVGFLVTCGAGLCFFRGHLGWGGFLILLGGLFDILDGYVARGTGLASVFGSFYDSTLDRVSEIVVFIGLFSVYSGGHPYVGEPWMVYTVALALAGSLMISYTRARAEGLGIDCKVGLMQRPERVVLLGIAAMLGTKWDGVVLTWVLIAMAVLTNLTAFQRIVWVYRFTRRHPPAGPSAGPNTAN